jgi:hypothetical protein
MTARFASWDRRYRPAERAARARGSWTVATLVEVRARADELERRVCRLADAEPAGVRRLTWTGRAIAAARSTAVHPAAAPVGVAAEAGRR